MARLLLIRHAPTAETGTRLTGRLAGVGLDAKGVEAAERLAAALADVALAAIYTSPLRRCQETARIVAAPKAIRPVQRRALIEVDYGEWTGRTLTSLQRTKLWRSVAITPSRVRFPGGESLVEVQARAAEACGALAAAHVGATIALVTHGDVHSHRARALPRPPAGSLPPGSWWRPPRSRSSNCRPRAHHGFPAVNRLAGAVI